MHMRIAQTVGLLTAGLVLGLAVANSAHSEHHSDPVVQVVAAPSEDLAPPAQYLGENDPIVPLVCGTNLNCSDVDHQRAAAAKPASKPSKSSRTVRTSHSSNGASSTTITEKSPAGSSTVTHSRTAKGVTTTSRSTTVSK